MILRGETVILRPLKLLDAAIFIKHINDPRVGRFTQYNWKENFSLKTEKAWIKKQAKLQRQKKTFVFTVIDKKTKDIVGVCDLHAVELKNKYAELGAWTAPKYWGKGYTKEAIILLINYAFDKIKLNKLEWIVFSYNKKSQRFAEKFGFKKEGIMRERYWRMGKQPIDNIIYGLLRKEWKG